MLEEDGGECCEVRLNGERRDMRRRGGGSLLHFVSVLGDVHILVVARLLVVDIQLVLTPCLNVRPRSDLEAETITRSGLAFRWTCSAGS